MGLFDEKYTTNLLTSIFNRKILQSENFLYLKYVKIHRFCLLAAEHIIKRRHSTLHSPRRSHFVFCTCLLCCAEVSAEEWKFEQFSQVSLTNNFSKLFNSMEKFSKFTFLLSFSMYIYSLHAQISLFYLL